jgi:hypothetical protein
MRINLENKSEGQLERAMVFTLALQKKGMTFSDAARAACCDNGLVTRYAYGKNPFQRSKIRTWVEENLEPGLAERLDHIYCKG